jgi:hypothetical protein
VFYLILSAIRKAAKEKAKSLPILPNLGVGGARIIGPYT